METLAIFLLTFLALRMFISLANLLSDLHLPDKMPNEFPKVSLLIPARNEEAVIGQLLSGLQRLNYPDFEVIVCNDHSSDNTEEILNWFAGDDDRIHWFLGEKLHDDWLGKNYACHQLAQRASGKYLIFLDADVELSCDAVTKAVSYFQTKKLSLLSVFPQQTMVSFAERMIVPVMNWILQSLLPMILVRTTSFPSLSAANGQFMMFETANYLQYQWHNKVRNLHVEDINLARMVKTEKLKMAVLLGNNDIFCRMYNNGNEAILGFSRNIHEYFGGKSAVMFGYWFVVCLAPFLVFFAFGWEFLIFFVPLVFANRLFVASASRQNIVSSVLLHPIQMLGFTAIVFYNLFRRIKKETTWKGRKINFQS